ncbi:MAG TPA: hypothetical protein VLE03_07440 [Nitrospiraceae bacterium]|nr:hypothetical protein [Nitrospiraceae bacterium]
MRKPLRTTLFLSMVVALSLLVPVRGEAQNSPDRDTKEIADYLLTDAGLAKYRQAVAKLQPLAAQLPQDCDQEDRTRSLNELAAQMDGIP